MANVSVLNTTNQLSGKTLVTAEGDWTVTGLITFDRDPSAPFAVSASSAKVTNLDADKLDGLEGSSYVTLTGTETLTNKTLTAPVLSGTVTGTYTLGGTPTLPKLTSTNYPATTSAELAGVISDETGSGLLVFGTSPTLTTPTISGAITFPDNVRQTFNPGADAAGLNVGSHAGNPGTPSNGDLWYNSTANELNARINGANVALGAGAVEPYAVTLANAEASGNTTVASFVVPANTWGDGETVLFWFLDVLMKNNSGAARTTTLSVQVGAGTARQIYSATWNDAVTEARRSQHYSNTGDGWLWQPIAFMRSGNDVLVHSSSTGNWSWFSNPNNGSNVLTSNPANFTSDITVSVIVNLAATHASYYFRPQKVQVIHFKNS